MTPLDIPLSSVQPDQLLEHFRKLKEFIATTDSPNSAGADGITCLRITLSFCNDRDGEDRIESLLRRGADPNTPNPLDNFFVYIATATRTEPLAMLIKAGLRLNDVYSPSADIMPTGRAGRFTLLDYALDIETYLKSRGKGFIKFAEKHAGPLAPRRRFIADTIELLRTHGAVSADK